MRTRIGRTRSSSRSSASRIPTASSTASTRSGGRATPFSRRRAALLESLRDRGLRTGLVANSWPDPARILRADAEALGLAAHLDAMVFSGDVGIRKPAPEIFLRACEELGVDPGAALFVGDDLERDVQGAATCGHDNGAGAVVQSRRASSDRAGLHGVHCDGRAQRRSAPSLISASCQVLRSPASAPTMRS